MGELATITDGKSTLVDVYHDKIWQITWFIEKDSDGEEVAFILTRRKV